MCSSFLQNYNAFWLIVNDRGELVRYIAGEHVDGCAGGRKKFSFPEISKEVLEYWEKNNTTSLDGRGTGIFED